MGSSECSVESVAFLDGFCLGLSQRGSLGGNGSALVFVLGREKGREYTLYKLYCQREDIEKGAISLYQALSSFFLPLTVSCLWWKVLSVPLL